MFKNILLSVSLFCACTVGLAQEKAAYTPEMQAFHNISSNEIYKFVEELCKPEYQADRPVLPNIWHVLTGLPTDLPNGD
nr:hypothetical protein [Odoribacter sp. OF09-27XD]